MLNYLHCSSPIVHSSEDASRSSTSEITETRSRNSRKRKYTSDDAVSPCCGPFSWRKSNPNCYKQPTELTFPILSRIIPRVDGCEDTKGKGNPLHRNTASLRVLACALHDRRMCVRKKNTKLPMPNRKVQMLR